MRRGWIIPVALIAVLGVAAGAIGNKMLARRDAWDRAAAMTGGDPAAGRGAIVARSCGGCPQIPGGPGAQGKVGPPLAGIAGRAYLAGRLPNTPDNMIRWITDPHAVDPQTAMPSQGVAAAEARDITA